VARIVFRQSRLRDSTDLQRYACETRRSDLLNCLSGAAVLFLLECIDI